MKNLAREYPILGSSANSKKLSESIRGALILLAPVVIRLSGVDIPEETLIDFINNGLVFWGSSVALFGLGRKLYYQALGLYTSFKK